MTMPDSHSQAWYSDPGSRWDGSEIPALSRDCRECGAELEEYEGTEHGWTMDLCDSCIALDRETEAILDTLQEVLEAPLRREIVCR